MSQVAHTFLAWCQVVTKVLMKKASPTEQRELKIALFEFEEAVKKLEDTDGN